MIPEPTDPAVFNDAISRFRRLSRERQYAVLREILLTRATELTLAYPNVLRVGLGHKRSRNRAGQSVLRDQTPPCLLFMVGRKWPRRSTRSEGRIPSHLLSFTPTAHGTMMLVAVPTDVDSAQWLAGARPDLSVKATVTKSGVFNIGSVCCTLRQLSAPSTVYGVSCRHVLSFGPRASIPGDTVDAGGAPLGAIADIKGAVVGPKVMDAQLFNVSPHIPLDHFPHYSGIVSSAQSIPTTLRLLAPSLSMSDQRVVSRGIWSAPLKAPSNPDLWMFAGELIELDLPGARTRAGDSGSPAVAGVSHPTLVGMHIGSVSSPHVNGFASLCIPAWRLLDPNRYLGTTATTVWRLV
jgi:hypothetical protein